MLRHSDMGGLIEPASVDQEDFGRRWIVSDVSSAITTDFLGKSLPLLKQPAYR